MYEKPHPEVWQGTDWSIELTAQKAGPSGVDLPVEPGDFTVADVLAAKVWPGDDRAATFTPTAAWVNVDAGTYRLTGIPAHTSSVAPGDYRLYVTVAIAGRVVPLHEGPFTIHAAPGSATAPKTYGGRQDLTKLAAWIDRARDLEEHQAGFVEQLGEARAWLQGVVMGRARRVLEDQARRHDPVLAVSPYTPTTGYDAGPEWGESIYPDNTVRDQLAVIQGYLDGDKLMTGSIDNGMAVRIASYYALALICEPQLGKKAPDGTPYQKLAALYRRRANRLLAGWIARIDTDADGKPNIELAA